MTSQTRRPIGIFDSGLGGLTVAREVARRLPEEDLIYLGDTARLPYGTKSPGTIVKYATKCVDFLVSQDVKVVVIACNTASAVALPALNEKYDIPILGVVGPGARAAVARSRIGRIGVIGTPGTIDSGSYHQAIRALRPTVKVFGEAAPLLVSLAEEGWTDNEVARLTLGIYLEPLVSKGIDTLVLGCTHYPLFTPLIRTVLADHFGVETGIVDSAQSVTDDLTTLLHDHGLLRRDHPEAVRSFFMTDLPARFVMVGERFFGEPFGAASQVEL